MFTTSPHFERFTITLTTFLSDDPWTVVGGLDRLGWTRPRVSFDRKNKEERATQFLFPTRVIKNLGPD